MTEAIVALHGMLPTAVLAYTSIAAIWGIVEHVRGARLSGTYAGILVLAEALLASQALFGVYALLAGRTPRDPLHVVYGLLAALLLPVVYVIVSRRQRLSLWLGLTCLVIVAASLRAYTTG